MNGLCECGCGRKTFWEPPGPFVNVNPCPDPFHDDPEEAPSRVDTRGRVDQLADWLYGGPQDRWSYETMLRRKNRAAEILQFTDALRAPAQPDTKGEGQAVFVSALDEKDHELLRDLANASPEASIIDLLVTEHAELLARVNRAPAPPQPPVSSEEDREVVRDWLKVLHSPPGLPAAIQAVLTDATTLASQHRGDR